MGAGGRILMACRPGEKSEAARRDVAAAAGNDQAAELLPPEPWDEAAWPAFTAKVKEATGRSGKALFHPLRLALTGQEQGPEMKSLLPLIGRARAAARLNGETA